MNGFAEILVRVPHVDAGYSVALLSVRNRGRVVRCAAEMLPARSWVSDSYCGVGRAKIVKSGNEYRSRTLAISVTAGYFPDAGLSTEIVLVLPEAEAPALPEVPALPRCQQVPYSFVTTAGFFPAPAWTGPPLGREPRLFWSSVPYSFVTAITASHPSRSTVLTKAPCGASLSVTSRASVCAAI